MTLNSSVEPSRAAGSRIGRTSTSEPGRNARTRSMSTVKPPRTRPLIMPLTISPFWNDSSSRVQVRVRLAFSRDKRVSLYISGHDHNLQHLQVDGFSPDFIVSGGGGASRYEVIGSDRGFSMQTRGFNHIHVTGEKMTVQFINPDGQRIHAYERDLSGKTTVLKG